MKNRIFGITAFLAVVVFSLMFTACPADEADRVCDFYNGSAAAITVTCAGSTPNSFTLAKLSNPALGTSDMDKVTVTRKGKDIEVTSIVVSGYEQYDPDDVIEFTGDIKAGSVIFRARSDGTGPLLYKVDAIPLDE